MLEGRHCVLILYCDTAALVKLLVEERGSDQIVEAANSAETIAVCRNAWAETMAALAHTQPLVEKAGTYPQLQWPWLLR